MERTCLECGITISGRVDKKFCSDQCRNLYNNRTKGRTTNYMRKVNRILTRNRNILADLNPKGKAKVTHSKLVSLGFNFSYFTHIYTTKSGNQYHFCYDQGYLALDNHEYALVVMQEYVHKDY